MRRAITIGTLVELTPYNNKDSSRTVAVKEMLGEGAGSIAYLVEEDGLQFVMKECFPYSGADRGSDGAVVWRSGDVEAKSKSRFERAFHVQASLMSDLDAMNQTAHLAGSLYQANDTLCTLTIRKNARTYDKVEESCLSDILVTAKSVASIVGAYHKAGYLHLDIKPENIMVYPETREMVQMIDFDSIISFSEKDLFAPSFSPQYAAPELLALDTKQICEATDIYEIGATVFEKVFGRAPEAWDRSIFSDWTFPELYNGKSEKLKKLSREFFRKTLTAGVKDRYQSIDELIRCLNALIKESEKEVFLISTLPDSKNTFVGREKELLEIADAFEHSGIVILTGIGGIGKTELALHYAKKYRDQYDVICFGKVIGSLEKLFDDPQSRFLSIHGENRDDKRGTKKIDDLVDNRTLFIIDNLDSLDDPMTDELFSMDCKVLVASRCDFHEEFPEIPQITIGELSEEDQIKLFLAEAGAAAVGCDEAIVRSILAEIDGYTLLIPLIAKLLPKSYVSPSELQRRIHSAGISAVPDTKIRQYKDVPLKGSVINILRTVFDMSALSDAENYVLKSILLFEGIYIEKQGLLEEIGLEYNDTVNDLAENGWIQLHGNFPHLVCSMHSIISQVYALDHRPRLSEMKWIEQTCKEFAEECDEYTEQVLDGTIGKSVDSIWDDTFFKPQNYEYLKENHIWQTIGERGFYFDHRRKSISSLLHNCVYENEDDVICLLGILDLIVKKDLSRAINYTFGTYGIDTLMYHLLSERTIIRCSFYRILFALRDLSHHRDGEEAKRVKIIDYLSEFTEQYCSAVRDLPGMRIREYFEAVCNVLVPYFDLGSSYGVGLFERDWDPGIYGDDETDEEPVEDVIDTDTARKFVKIVEKLMNIVRVAFADKFEEEKQMIEERYIAFQDGMSEERFLDFYWNRWDAASEQEESPEHHENSESVKAWSKASLDCYCLARECMAIGFGRTISPKTAKLILDEENQMKAAKMLPEFERLLKIEADLVNNGKDLPIYVEELYDQNLQEYRFAKLLLYMIKGEQDKAVSLYSDYLDTQSALFVGALEGETRRLALYKPYCDSSCIARMAKQLYDRFPSYVQRVENELNPIELDIPEKRKSLQLGALNFELTIAELMGDTELQRAIKQKLNILMGTNF